MKYLFITALIVYFISDSIITHTFRNEINELKQHTEILDKAVKAEQYRTDILTEMMRK